MANDHALAALTFSGWNWLWPSVALGALALAVVVWSYRAAPPGWPRWACALLKTLGIVALALCLLEPLWTSQRAKPGANAFAVVADNSQGMQIKDRAATVSRGEELRALLAPRPGDWQETLGENFDVRRYLFDARLRSTEDFRELVFDGRSSGIAGALRTLKERFQGRPLAGVLLLTDGNATDLGAAPLDVAGLPPIYPVVIGRTEPARDLSVQQVQVSQTAFEDAPVTIQADVAASGFRGRAVTARLVDVGGAVVREQTMEPRSDREALTYRFQLKPEKPGLSFYELRVAAKGELTTATPAAGGEVAPTEEATLINNRRVVVVNRGQGPYRVLYVTGRPNWEFKFLNRAIDGDREVQLVGLIRVAKREPKFDFRGRAGESSNPLFRGFGAQSAEEAERYDQPVLVRLNTRDAAELSTGFPRTPEDLFGYHAIIIDDLESEFFTPDQAMLVQKFVSERGGGVMMLGGMESFQQGNYHRTPIGDMLPVYLDKNTEGAPVATAAPEGDGIPATGSKLELAREGWLQAWARLRDNEADERRRQDNMTTFDVVNPVRGVKPGASVIATVRSPSGAETPALAVQRFGRGRTAALTLGDVWRWGMRDAEARADMDKAWRQWVRWLIADVPARVELSVEPVEGDAQGAVRLQVRVRDAKFKPFDDASVALEIESVKIAAGPTSATANAAPAPAPTAPIRLQAEPSLDEAGLYQAVFVPRETGGFRATAIATNTAGAEVGRAENGWSSDLAAEEFRSLTPNVAFLEDLARRTGGAVIAADALAAFSRELPARNVPVMETWSQPLWHTPWMFAFALVCLVAEWGLRRVKGMP